MSLRLGNTLIPSLNIKLDTGASRFQTKTTDPTAAMQEITADSGYDALSKVIINAIQTETKSITSNGTYSPSSGKYFSSVSVNVPVGTTLNNQDKTVNPSESQQVITADSGYTGLDSVTVNAISSTYVGSGIATRNANSLTASGATVTVPAGYYASQATKSIASGSVATPATTITANPSLSTTYTSGSGYKMSVSKTQSVTPTVSAGYVSSGTAGTITVSGSAYVAQSAITNNTTLPSGSSSSGTINEGSYLKIGAGYYPTDRYYMAQARTNGSVNNPTATKGTVSNNSVSVTPSVSYTAGYISAGSKNGTAVTVSASELVSGNKAITANGTNIDVANYATVSVNVPVGSTISNQNKTVSPTTSQQTVTFDSGYTGLGTVTVNAMSTITLPTAASASATSGFTSKATISRSTSDQYINIPTGYNSAGAYYKVSAVANGTAGTPTASKGTVSNNSISITPSVTNTTGYITGSTKTGTAVTVSASELVSGTLSVTSNGTKDVTNYASINVNVPTGTTINNQNKTVSSSETNQTITADSGYTGLGTVSITGLGTDYVGSDIARRSSTDPVQGTWQYSSNSSYGYATCNVTIPAGYYSSQFTKGFTKIISDIQDIPKLGATNITPTESSQIAVNKFTWTTGDITVNAIPSDYVGSSITRNASRDLNVNGAIITAPAGYYEEDASASVASMTLPTAASSTRSGTTKATIGRSTSAQYINIPIGYNASAASYTISATPNGSVTAPGTISGTAATVSTGTNTLTLTKTISVTPNVTTAGYISAGTAGNSAISLTASVTTKAAATITPGTSDQTIAAGTYLTGIQTISGDANLKAENIKSGVAIFGTTGTFSGLDTSDANAVAANILYGKTAYVNGSKVTGTMANNGATGGTITTQGGTYTIPAGYTSGGTVTASLTASTLTNSIINGSAYEEDTGDYAWRTTINIPAGYHNATTLTKDFSSIFPAPDTPATASQILLGYQVYDEDGKLITGTMANNTYSNTLNDTRTSITIPAGYHNGTGTVSHTTVNIPDPTISVSAAGVITASGSWTKGYTTDSSYSNTYNLTTLGATTYNVSSSNQTITSGKYITGTQTIRAVTTSNITAANIKAGTIVQVGDSADSDRILSVTGTFTSDANAVAADILDSKTAYVNGNKITGTLTVQDVYVRSSAPNASIGSDGDIWIQE